MILKLLILALKLIFLLVLLLLFLIFRFSSILSLNNSSCLVLLLLQSILLSLILDHLLTSRILILMLTNFHLHLSIFFVFSIKLSSCYSEFILEISNFLVFVGQSAKCIFFFGSNLILFLFLLLF